jgi:hypothetical protein
MRRYALTVLACILVAGLVDALVSAASRSDGPSSVDIIRIDPRAVPAAPASSPVRSPARRPRAAGDEPAQSHRRSRKPGRQAAGGVVPTRERTAPASVGEDEADDGAPESNDVPSGDDDDTPRGGETVPGASGDDETDGDDEPPTPAPPAAAPAPVDDTDDGDADDAGDGGDDD